MDGRYAPVNFTFLLDDKQRKGGVFVTTVKQYTNAATSAIQQNPSLLTDLGELGDALDKANLIYGLGDSYYQYSEENDKAALTDLFADYGYCNT